MKKLSVVIFAIMTLLISSCSLAKLIAPSSLETVMAVKEVMNSSAVRAIAKLAKLSSDNPTDALPKEMQPVLATLRTLGLGDEVNKITKVVGDASGIAMTESTALFADAIKQVDLGDAASIVLGGPDAASQVLKNNMKIAVRNRYASRISEQLGQTEAIKYWPLAANAYNMFSKTKVESDLSTFLADRAVDGIFLAMGHEEQTIRKDVKSLGSQVVTKVWDYYSKKGKA